MLFEPGNERIRRAPKQRHQFAAARCCRTLRHFSGAPGFCPIFHRAAGNRGDVIACLLRHRAGAGEPFLHAARAGIVGGGRQPEIAELVAQLRQKLGRLRQRLHGIEGIEQAAFTRGSRHELRDPLCALAAPRHRADGVRLKAAFLPDHTREKFQRQALRPRRGFDHQAHRLAGVAFACGVGGFLRRYCQLFDAGSYEAWRVVGARRRKQEERSCKAQNRAESLIQSHCTIATTSSRLTVGTRRLTAGEMMARI